MDAECTGCGGRVMPYRQYIFHFRPTATCGSCGQAVRLRHFTRVAAVFLAIVAAYTLLLASAPSTVFILIGLVLAVLISLLADFWTFRNLSWDPVDDTRREVDPA